MMLQPLFVILTTVLLSFLIGLPLSLYFRRPLGEESRFDHVVLYLAPVIGYSILNLAIFYSMEFLQSGTDRVARPCLLALLGVALALIFVQRKQIQTLFDKKNWPFLALMAALFLAATHVLLPVLTGKWEMAYATGDDASRWYMVVNYFRHNTFEYMKVTEETLKWGMRERPLQNVAGAIVASLFNTSPAISYSVASALAMAMAAASFCLFFESLFPVQQLRNRYVLWWVAILFFGMFGSFTNIYYTGRVTHHYSLYPVLASLCFVAIEDKGVKRLVWFILWGVLLALYYSVRFSLNFFALVFVLILFQWIGKQADFKSSLKNVLFMILGFAVSCGAAYGEVKVIIQSIINDGFFFLMLQRDAGYGADGTFLDRVYKWSGFLGTYESYLGIPLWLRLGLGAILLFSLLLALWWALKSFRKAPVYTGLAFFSLATAMWLFLTQNYYVAWKSALYWPSYALLGVVAFSFSMLEEDKILKQKIGLGVLSLVFLFILSTSRQMGYYFSMVDERYTKVDKVSYRMVDIVSAYLQSNQNVPSRRIFGFDYSAERHLLLREIFRDFEWQPIRAKELWFEHDMIHKHAETFDEYRYGALLYANTFICEPFDLSGNQPALLFDHYPFIVYKSNASLVELRSGIEMAIYGYNEARRSPLYGGQLNDDTSTVVFANNGTHNWLVITFRTEKEGRNLSDELLSLSVDGKPMRDALRLVEKNEMSAIYDWRLEGLEKKRLWHITAVKRNLKGKVLIVNTKFGYTDPRKETGVLQ